MMSIIKIGIPCRWNKTVRYRRKAGEELSARCTSVHTANIPLTAKITWLSTYALTQEKSPTPAITALTVPPPKTNSYHTSAYTPGRSPSPVHTVVTVPPRKTNSHNTFAPTQERNPLTVPCAPSGVPQRIP